MNDIYKECIRLATHYQIGLPKTDMMDTLEYIRDNVILYDDEDINDDESY